MEQKIAYSYHPDTGEYLGEYRCQPDPLNGGYLLPAHATMEAPPDVPDGRVALWRGDRWEVVTDARQSTWWHKVTGEAYRPQLPEEIVNVDFYVDTPPPGLSEWERWDDERRGWVEDPPLQKASVTVEDLLEIMATCGDISELRAKAEALVKRVEDASARE